MTQAEKLIAAHDKLDLAARETVAGNIGAGHVNAVALEYAAALVDYHRAQIDHA